MATGFTKGGKFRPTDKKHQSVIHKGDVYNNSPKSKKWRKSIKLDPYKNSANWLTRKEIDDTREQMDISDTQLKRDFDISNHDFIALMKGSVKKIKIGKKSPHFDYEIVVPANPHNPLSRGGFHDTRKPL